VKPVIALVGRPNVGKSTLFNRLTRSRDAIVHDVPGVTRDRHYGEGRQGDRAFIAIDTGGLELGAEEGIYVEMARQAEQAIAESDAVVFMVDGRAGLTGGDREIAAKLRLLSSPVYVAVNKAEGMQPDTAVAEFHELGLGAPAPISGAHGEGVRELMDLVLSKFSFPEERSPDEAPEKGHPRVAVVGRPNVGKSTLINALVGEERVIAFDTPGTTRDPIEVPFERAGRRYTLIDTAGVRRRGKTGTPVEFFSIVKALQAIEAANVAILTLDAVDGVTLRWQGEGQARPKIDQNRAHALCRSPQRSSMPNPFAPRGTTPPTRMRPGRLQGAIIIDTSSSARRRSRCAATCAKCVSSTSVAATVISRARWRSAERG
jgi:GTP-binding protein